MCLILDKKSSLSHKLDSHQSNSIQIETNNLSHSHENQQKVQSASTQSLLWGLNMAFTVVNQIIK